jgi:hypothetical protein
MSQRFALIALLLAVVCVSSITAIVVHANSNAAVVRELKREDRERKAGEAEAEKWSTDPGKPAVKY